MKKIQILIMMTIYFASPFQTKAKIELKDYQPLECQTFITTALQHDQSFAIDLQVYLKSTYKQLELKGLTNWQLSAKVGQQRQEDIYGQVFDPKATTSTFYEVTLEKLFLPTGTRLSLSHEQALSDHDYYQLDPLVNQFLGSSFNFPQQTSTPVFTITLIQPLIKNVFGLADRFPIEASNLQAQAAKLDVQEAWENRLVELYTIYLTWVATYEAVQAIQEIVHDLNRLEQDFRTKVKAGVAEEPELLRIIDNRLNYESQLEEREGQFVNLMQEVQMIQAGQSLAPTKIKQLKPIIFHQANYLGLDVKAKPKSASQLRLIQKLNLMASQLKLKKQVDHNGLLPQVDMLGRLSSKGLGNDKHGGYEDLEQTDYQLLLQAKWPLFSDQAKGKLKQTESDLKSINLTKQVSTRQLTLALTQLQETIQRTERINHKRDQQVQNGLRKLSIDKQNYRIGRLDTYYLIDSEMALVNARLQLVKNQVQLNQLKIQYLALNDQLLTQLSPEQLGHLNSTIIKGVD